MKVVPLRGLLFEPVLGEVIERLRAGALLVYPTDTLYGLGGDFMSLAVAERIDSLKGRADAPYSAAVSDLIMLTELAADLPPLFSNKLAGLLPGPYTFLFRPSAAVDSELIKHSGKIGVRMPAVPEILSLIRLTGRPLFSTSVNRSGQPPMNDPAAIARRFPNVDLIVDGGVLPPSPGSTVLDLTVEPATIRRRGAGFERLQELLLR